MIVVLAIVAGILYDAWVFMISVGIVHAEWLPMLPTIGFGASVAIVTLFALMAIPAWIINALAS